MDDTQLKYQRLLKLDDDELIYGNYKLVFDTVIDGRLTYKRHSVIKACCIEHALDIGNNLKKLNENVHVSFINKIG